MALEAGADIIAHGLFDWREHPQRLSDLTPSIKGVLDREVQSRTFVQPTMQVAYGFRDLFDPAYLDDPRVQLVYPCQLRSRGFRSPQGQWFHDIIASGGFCPRICGIRAMVPRNGRLLVPPMWSPLRGIGIPPSISPSTARGLLFGTDTPAVPSYANPPGLNGWLEMHRLVEAGMTPGQVFRAANAFRMRNRWGLEGQIGTVQVGKRA